MKFYIVARFGLKDEVRRIYKLLQDKGHKITLDWTQQEAIKPNIENQDLSKEYSIASVDGVIESDVFILISSDAGSGIYVELGTAISEHLKTGRPKIYVVGEHTARTLFYFHPSVNRRKTVEEVFEELGI